MRNETITLIGGISIALLTIIGNVIITILNKQKDYKLSLYKTIIECSYKEYEHTSNMIIDLTKKDNKPRQIEPFATCLLFNFRFFKLILKSKNNEKEYKKFKEKYEFERNLYLKYIGK